MRYVSVRLNLSICIILIFASQILRSSELRMVNQATCADATVEPKKPDELAFIIKPSTQKKKLSANALKESIGSTTKEVVEGTTAILNELGLIQHALSSMQKQVAASADTTVAVSMLSACASATDIIGTLLVDVAKVQKTCSALVSKLIDNDAPFKKAKKGCLDTTLSMITTAEQKLFSALDQLKSCHQRLKTGAKKGGVATSLLESENKTLALQRDVLAHVVGMMRDDALLKQV